MGGGGKGGGGSGHTPVEHPDTLKSRQRAQIVDLVCEGPIWGPVDGLKSVYLNDTPVLNENGSANFSGVDTAWRSGHQVQDPLPELSALENEVSVGMEVKQATPLVRTITNLDVSRVRVTLGVAALVTMSDKGDRSGATVELRIEVGVNGAWSLAKIVTISGKTKSPYTESHVVTPPHKNTPWSVRVVRMTPDSATDRLQNKTQWASFTEIIDAKLTYPNSAIVGLRFDSEQFQSIPRRNYHLRGLIVQVPSNYDTDTREYTGIWNGLFKPSWTDNPAWIMYDLITNERYGMGRAMVGFAPDKWQLYQIAQYCDQLVDDGYGGKEPRFTCNIFIADQRQAHTVINDLSSVFRGMPVWDGLQLGFNQDRPQDSVWQFNNSNVADGSFRYQSSAKKSRHTAAQVEYVDKDSGWEKQTEYVQDDDLITRYGLNLLKVTAFGCTSRGQAHRVGQWLLVTEKLERQQISFEVGREGLVCLPGDIIDVIDNHYAGARLGGRVLAVSGNTVTLDAPINITEQQTNWFHYLDDNSQLRRLQVFSPTSGTTDTLILGGEPVGMGRFDTFNVSTANLKPRKWRVVGISENREQGTYGISALQHVPEKHAIIEDGLAFDPPDNTLLGGKLPPIEHLRADLLPESDLVQVRLTWDTPRVLAGIVFDIKVIFGGRVVVRETTGNTEYFISGVEQGDYSVEIRATNAMGQLGPATSLVFTVAPPRAPDSLAFTPTNFSVTVRPMFTGPANSLGTTYEFYGGISSAELLTMANFLGRGFILDQQGLKPDTTYWYGVVAVNALGRSAMTTGSSKTLLQPEDILQLIGPEIPKLDWAKDLSALVDENSSGLVLLSDRAALAVNLDGRVSGITVTAESEASAVDFLADFVSFTDPDTLERNLYWDNTRKTLVVKGEMKLLDGTTVSSKSDLGNGAGGLFRLKTDTGVFPANAVATSLFQSSFNTDPGIDTVLTVYAETTGGIITRADSKMFNGIGWVTPKLFIDGDLVAAGTIKGDRLVAGTEITAPKIRGGEIEIGDRFSVDGAGNMAAVNMTAHNAQLTGTLEVPTAAIKSAHIGVAEVDTLRIAGSAVTVPASVYVGGNISYYNGAPNKYTEKHMLRLWVDLTDVEHLSLFLNWNNSYKMSGGVNVILKRNGQNIRNASGHYAVAGDHSISLTDGVEGINGSAYYDFYFGLHANQGTTYNTINGVSMIGIGTKR